MPEFVTFLVVPIGLLLAIAIVGLGVYARRHSSPDYDEPGEDGISEHEWSNSIR